MSIVTVRSIGRNTICSDKVEFIWTNVLFVRTNKIFGYLETKDHLTFIRRLEIILGPKSIKKMFCYL